MKIAIIGSQASIHIVRWANALAKRGNEVFVISMHESFQLFNDNVSIIKLPFKNPFGYILNILTVRKVLKQIQPDIVHTFYAFGHGFLARTSGYPYVLSVMGSDIYDDVKNPIFKSIVKNNILNASVVCSTSNIMAKQIEKVCQKNIPIEITPFGIDISKFYPREIKQDNQHDFVIGTVKWMEKKYGVDILIKAFALFCEKYPNKNFKLILVGGGNQLTELKKLAQKLGIAERCEFVGNVLHDEVPIWLSKMDVYAALSRFDSESFGVAVLEASACGLPVVVSNADGLTEVVDDGNTGIIVPKENVKASSQAFVELYEQRGLTSNLGMNGVGWVQNNYSWVSSVSTMENIYKQNLLITDF